MFGYRALVNELYAAASAEAAGLVLLFAQSQHAGHSEQHTQRLRTQTGSLRAAVDKFLDVLPEDMASPKDNLERHLHFIDYYLGMSQAENCTQDPVDILQRDLPQRLQSFNEWYEQRSRNDASFVDRVNRLHARGQTNAAVREAWAIFKTRMVEAFNLPTELDGERLAVKLFGPEGETASILDNEVREGYLNLFRGLYALSRNPTTHNDILPDPQKAEAVLALISSALAEIEAARATVAYADLPF